MTFETLAYIHHLLTEEEKIANRNLTTRMQRLDSLYDADAPSEEIEDAITFKRIAVRHHTDALRALTEFENHEWR
jgi:hypothetical protein